MLLEPLDAEEFRADRFFVSARENCRPGAEGTTD
jgi:hypothetical protein